MVSGGSELSLLEGLRGSWLPELSSALGLVLTVFGLWMAFKAARDAASMAGQARDAAKEAREAAQSARDELIRIESFIDLSSVITAMENIKTLHREKAWSRLADRYSEARRLLIQVRSKTAGLSENQRLLITNCVANFSALEINVDRNAQYPDRFNVTRANQNISESIDNLVEMLHDLRSSGV